MANQLVQVPGDTLGGRIKVARIAADMKVTTLAERCGVTRQTVHNWESQEISDVDSTMALRIAHVLNVRPEWLILGRLPMHPNFKLRELQAIAAQLEDRALDTLIENGLERLARQRHARRPQFSVCGHASRPT